MARSRRSASQRAPRSSTTVEREAVVGAPPVIVRRALTEGELVKRWWSAWSGCAVDDATLDARPGGRGFASCKSDISGTRKKERESC